MICPCNIKIPYIALGQYKFRIHVIAHAYMYKTLIRDRCVQG